MSRVVKIALWTYPRRWRDRYGSELGDLTHELIERGEMTPLISAASLVRAGALERVSSSWRHRKVVMLSAATLLIGVAIVLPIAIQHTGQVRTTKTVLPVSVTLEYKCLSPSQSSFPPTYSAQRIRNLRCVRVPEATRYKGYFVDRLASWRILSVTDMNADRARIMLRDVSESQRRWTAELPA
jgi:hypothetical protein